MPGANPSKQEFLPTHLGVFSAESESLSQYAITPPCMIKSAVASEKVEKGDIVVIPGIVYDSRSKITKLSDDIVYKGIANYLPGKAMRFRHIDPNEDAYALMGQVSTAKTIQRQTKVDPKSGKDYMIVIANLEFEAITEDHAEYLEGVIADGIGLSLGWIESAVRFIPHEVSPTPFPKCETCETIPNSATILKGAAAEKVPCKTCEENKKAECDKSKIGEQKMSDELKDKLQEANLDYRLEIKEKDIKISSLSAELAEAKSESAKTLQSQIAEVSKQNDTVVVEKEAKIKELEGKVAELEGKLHESETLPIRNNIAEKIMGLTSEALKAKVASLGNMTKDQLVSYETDMILASKSASKENELTPFLAGSNEITPNFAENGIDPNLSDKDFATKFMGEDFMKSIDRR